jgi:hypothetical protein
VLLPAASVTLPCVPVVEASVLMFALMFSVSAVYDRLPLLVAEPSVSAAVWVMLSVPPWPSMLSEALKSGSAC